MVKSWFVPCAALVLLAGVVANAQRYNPSTRRLEFPAGTTSAPVPVPDAPECQVSIEFWENGSYLAQPGDYPTWAYGDRPAKLGTPVPAGPGTSTFADLMWMRTVFAAALQHSADMRAKTKDACKVAGGASGIQVRLVNDDPDVDVANAQVGSNLIFIDVADVRRLTSSTELYVGVPASAQDALLDEFITKAVHEAGPALVFGLIAHEMDHLRETGNGAHADPNGLFADDALGGAVRDENLVMRELGFAVQRSRYMDLRAIGADLQSVIPYEIRGIDATLYFLPDKALGAVATPGTVGRNEHRFTSGGIGDVPATCCGCGFGAAPDECTEAPSWTTTVDASAWLGSRSMGMTSIEPVRRGRTGGNSQTMGGTVLEWMDNDTMVVARDELRPRPSILARLENIFGGLIPKRTALRAIRTWRVDDLAQPWPEGTSTTQNGNTRSDEAPVVIFTSTGASSGDAFQVTVASRSDAPIGLTGDGFVLEPVEGVRASDVERELQRMGGRPRTATLTAYCLEMAKPAPAAGMMYRLVPAARARAAENSLAAIMRASRRLKDFGALRPDSDPEEYFHFIRQWAIWTREQNWRSEAEFTTALVEHTRKTFATARQTFTPAIVESIRRIAPGRWQDVTAVLAVAGMDRR